MSSLHQQLILEEYIDFLSNRSDHIFIEAVMGLVTGMTASSAEMSNNFSFK
ncbi:MAG: hypothetical protein ABIP80_01715 [Ferruginibacter sp.]